MTTIIEQADKIVGIDWRCVSNPNWTAAMENTHRRGAYCEWLAESKRRAANDTPPELLDSAAHVLGLLLTWPEGERQELLQEWRMQRNP